VSHGVSDVLDTFMWCLVFSVHAGLHHVLANTICVLRAVPYSVLTVPHAMPGVAERVSIYACRCACCASGCG
jgi:hypothetical protein